MLALTLHAASPHLHSRRTRSDRHSDAALYTLRATRAAGDGSGLKSNANTHLIENVSGESGSTVVITAAELPTLPVLHIKGCSGVRFEVAADVSMLVKVLVEGCENVAIALACGVKTETLELWKCARTRVLASGEARLKTVQLDLSRDVGLEFECADMCGSIVQAGVRGLCVTFADKPGVRMTDSYEQLVERFPGANDTTDQFVSRLVAECEGEPSVCTERLLRLANDFPTTESEQAAAVADKQRARDVAAAALRAAEESGSELTDEQRAELRATAAAAAASGGESMGVGPSARAEHRKALGNEAFKAKEFTQAAVLYTEAIELDGSLHVVYANRAACFLQMREFRKALADCKTCQGMAPDYVKAHFREGMALMELAKEDGSLYADAARAFSKTLDLDPKNVAARSSLPIATAKAQRYAMEQARA